MFPILIWGDWSFVWGLRPPKSIRGDGTGSNLRFFRSKSTVLKKVLVKLLGLFGAPIAIRRPRNCAPLAPCYAPAQ